MEMKTTISQIDGSRLASLNDDELEHLLEMRIEELREYKKQQTGYGCTPKVFNIVCRIHEVTNAIIQSGVRKYYVSYPVAPLFIPPLYTPKSPDEDRPV
jgi:hypothetical protein